MGEMIQHGTLRGWDAHSHWTVLLAIIPEDIQFERTRSFQPNEFQAYRSKPLSQFSLSYKVK